MPSPAVRSSTGSFLEVHAEPWAGVLAFPTVNAVLDYYRSTAYFKMAFDVEADRSRLAGRVSEILRARFGDGPAPLTVGGAIFICTGRSVRTIIHKNS